MTLSLSLRPSGATFSASAQAVNILILGDGWKKSDRKNFEAACENIAKQILTIDPFSLLKDHINIFSRFVASSDIHTPAYNWRLGNGKHGTKDYGVYYNDSAKTLADNTAASKTAFKIYYRNDPASGGLDDVGLGCYTPQAIYDAIKQLEYTDDSGVKRITGADVWCRATVPDPADATKTIPNKSYGMVGIILPNKRSGGSALTRTATDGAATITFKVFALDTYNDPFTTFVHELAHNLLLNDEYENDETGVTPPYKYDVWAHSGWPAPGPNIILRGDITTNPNRDLSQGLTMAEIDAMKWRNMMSLADICCLKDGSGCHKRPEFYDIKVTIDANNEEIYFLEEDLGPVSPIGPPDIPLVGVINHGTYAIDALCTEVQTALNSAGGANTYTVSYGADYKIQIASSGPFFSIWWDYMHTISMLAYDLGFYDASANIIPSIGATSYTADQPFTDPGKADYERKNTDFNAVMLVEGGYYVRHDAFRSNLDCLMRHVTQPQDGGPIEFCKVCRCNIIQALTGKPAEYLLGNDPFFLESDSNACP